MVSALTSPRAAHAVRATVALDLSRPDRYMYDNPYAPEGMGREYINEPNELNLGAYFAGETMFEPWDPLGLCLLSKVSANNPDVAFFREAELKHGRMAMLAFVGIVVTTGGKHWPAEAFAQATAAGWPDSLGTLAKTNPGIVAQGLATVGIIEGASNTNRGAWWDGLWFGERPDSPVVASDLGFDPLGVMPKDPKAADLMRLKELKNGRCPANANPHS